jgi:hypothetical protein
MITILDEKINNKTKEIKDEILQQSAHRINEIGTTTDKITGRAGLSFFSRYLDRIGLRWIIESFFGSIRKSRKGKGIYDLFKQVICFFLDGSSRHLTYFDSLKKDEGYAASIEFTPGQMISSHGIKRFFSSFSYLRNHLFRKLLQKMFLWRLKLEKPLLLLLDIDTMVLDNDDAQKRMGVSPTYKKKKGFQPYMVKWGRYIIDVVFRGGKKHSNHGDTVKNSLAHLVRLIRCNYSAEIPIIVTCDSGFYDQKLFEYFERELCIHYICTGKLYEDIRERVAGFKSEDFFIYRKNERGQENEQSQWKCVELRDRRNSWKKERRALYSVHIVESNQRLLFGVESIYYTNIGENDYMTDKLEKAGFCEYLKAENIIKLAHQRGEAELVHRNLKEFGFEQMPFKRFSSNHAFFQMMVLSFNLYESFKWDICQEVEVLALSSQPNTFRRTFIDIAGKIVCHGRKCILKVTREVRERLSLERIWEFCNRVPELLC